jgi:hypothetical protein
MSTKEVKSPEGDSVSVKAPNNFIPGCDGHWWGVLFDTLPDGTGTQLFKEMIRRGYTPRPGKGKTQATSKVYFKRFDEQEQTVVGVMERDVAEVAAQCGITFPNVRDGAPTGEAGQPHYVIFKVVNRVDIVANLETAFQNLAHDDNGTQDDTKDATDDGDKASTK